MSAILDFNMASSYTVYFCVYVGVQIIFNESMTGFESIIFNLIHKFHIPRCMILFIA